MGAAPESDPPTEDILGSFAVDGDGRLIPDSFRYNPGHLWFHPQTGPSGLLSDRKFHDWLHPEAVAMPVVAKSNPVRP